MAKNTFVAEVTFKKCAISVWIKSLLLLCLLFSGLCLFGCSARIADFFKVRFQTAAHTYNRGGV